MKRSDSGYRWIVLSFLFPVFGLLLFFALHKITPFGNNSFLIHDMNHQYAEYFAYMKTVLQGENDFRYSLSRGLGGDFYSFFAYYLVSPLNLIPILMPDQLMPLGISIEMLLYFGLAGMACYRSLKHFVPEIGSLTFIYFSTAYSLSGWFLLNAENFQFLPAAVLFPLIVMELDKNSHSGKMIWLVILLTITIMLNFYLGYMVCIFVVLWTFTENGIKRSGKIWLSLLLTGFICIPFILLIFRQLLLSVKNTDPLWYAPEWNFSIAEYLKKILPGQFEASQYMDNGLPPVYCGMIVPVLSILYFFRKPFGRNKQRRMILLLVLFLSLIFRPLTMVWQGFSLPRWWPYRFAFLFIFMLILTAAESGIKLPVYLLIIGFCGLLFNMDRTLCVKTENAVPVDRYIADTGEKQALISEIKGKDGGLFRIDDLHPRTDNDPMHYSYLGITNFDSLAKRSSVNFLRKMGFPNNRYTISYGHGNTLFANMLLGVRYVLDGKEIINRAPNAGLAFISEVNLTSEIAEKTDPLSYQNELAHALGIRTDILSKYEPGKVEYENIECDQVFCWKTDAFDPAYIRYTFDTDNEGFLYAQRGPDNSIGSLHFLNAEEKIPYTDQDFFIPLGELGPDEEKIIIVEVNDPILDIPEITFIREDYQAVKDFADQAFRDITCTKKSSSELEIIFPADQEKRNLIVTIPFDSGWTAFSDSGEKLNINSVWNTFIGVQIPEKTTGIRLIYRQIY